MRCPRGSGSRNMRISTAYFAGVGTVIVAVGAGLGGGYLAANVTNPPTQAVSKLERRMSAEPITVATAPAEPVPHVAATNPAAAPAQEQTRPQLRSRFPRLQNKPSLCAWFGSSIARGQTRGMNRCSDMGWCGSGWNRWRTTRVRDRLRSSRLLFPAR